MYCYLCNQPCEQANSVRMNWFFRVKALGGGPVCPKCREALRTAAPKAPKKGFSLEDLGRELLGLSDEGGAPLTNTLLDIRRALELHDPEKALAILHDFFDGIEKAY
jgi:hypothetical protein